MASGIAAEPTPQGDRSAWRNAERYSTSDAGGRAVLEQLDTDLRGLRILDTPVWVFDAERCQLLWANAAGLEVWRAESVAELQARDIATKQSEAVYAQLNDYLVRVLAGEQVGVWVKVEPKGTSRRFYQSHHALRLADGRQVLLIEARTEPPPEEILALASSYTLTLGLYSEDGRLLSGNAEFGALAAVNSLATLQDVIPRDGSLADWPTQLDLNARLRFQVDLVTDRGTRIFRADLRRVRTRGEPPRAMLTLYDVTEERVAEAERGRAKAEAAMAARSELIAWMSHELRTPLNGVLGYLNLCLATDLGPKSLGYVRNAERAGRRLLGVVSDVLDLSKVEAGAMVMEQVPFSLESTLGDVESTGAPIASQNGVELRVVLVADTPFRTRYAVGDAARLVQILLNLVGNALKFTERGHVELRAEVHAAEPSADLRDAVDRAAVTFTVTDTGMGIEPADLPRIMEPFAQADGSISRRFGGTGLGLSIARRLVEQLGGRLWVTSTPGVGSRFGFTWVMEFVESPVAETSSAEAWVEDRDRLRGVRVLVVEDNPFNAEVFTELLRHAGAAVDTACNGEEALAKFKELPSAVDVPYDVVIMDVQMPRMDGYEATRRLRARPELSELPILGMTANAGLEDLRSCIAAGMSEVVTKPIVPAKLFDVVSRWSPVRSAPRTHEKKPSHLPDITVLMALSQGDRAKARRLAELYCRTTGEGLEELSGAVAEERPAEVSRIAHRLVSASGTVGDYPLVATLKAIEANMLSLAFGEARPLLDVASRQLSNSVQVFRDGLE